MPLNPLSHPYRIAPLAPSLDTPALRCRQRTPQKKRAMRIKTDLRVSDKRWCYLVLRAYAESEQWLPLEKFSYEKKPVIGFKAFAEVHTCSLAHHSLTHVRTREGHERGATDGHMHCHTHAVSV